MQDVCLRVLKVRLVGLADYIQSFIVLILSDIVFRRVILHEAAHVAEDYDKEEKS